MKQLTGSAQVEVEVPLEACYALLTDVERYPDWYSEVVRDVSVVARAPDGLAAKLHATLHVARGPLVRDLHLTLAVERRPQHAVSLVRLPNEPGDPEKFRVDWRLTKDGARTQIGLELAGSLDVPRMVPLAGIGGAMADGFVAAAARGISRNR
jgi:ribosome-associated toxin RatA of RatAB toxin-antitoxin module